MVIYIKPDILECEFNCASESITMNKASGDEIPYEYSVEMTNRFKGFDLIECLEELWMEICDTVQEAVIKDIPKKKKCKIVV